MHGSTITLNQRTTILDGSGKIIRDDVIANFLQNGQAK